jgi:hypothetical protein
MNLKAGLPSEPEGEIEVNWPRSQRLQALRTSFDIWCKSSKTSALAAKAAEALRVMLKDLESAEPAEAVPQAFMSKQTTVSGMIFLVYVSTTCNTDHLTTQIQCLAHKFLLIRMRYTLKLPINLISTPNISLDRRRQISCRGRWMQK